MSGFGLKLDSNLTHEEAKEASRPPKIPAGTYDFELDSMEFVVSSNDNPGIRFMCKIVSSDDEQWNGRKLRYDGWVTPKANFLTPALLAFTDEDTWPDVSEEANSDEGFQRVRDGNSEIMARMIGTHFKARVIHEKNEETGEVWPRLKSFVLD